MSPACTLPQPTEIVTDNLSPHHSSPAQVTIFRMRSQVVPYTGIGAVDQNRDELIVRPTSDEIAGPKSAPHSLRNHMQNGGACQLAVGGAEVVQALNLNRKDAEWKVVAREGREIFAQVELGVLVIWKTGGFVHAPVRGQSVRFRSDANFCSSKLSAIPIMEPRASRIGAIRMST